MQIQGWYLRTSELELGIGTQYDIVEQALQVTQMPYQYSKEIPDGGSTSSPQQALLGL